ncbi:MAG: Ig-like domain-containing protein [Bacteroidaceae bacterium]|nr:Ig-like domain-containing protein [Bacteroidaceae bacterium]
MKTRYLISLAALALMMGSCSSEVNQESAQEAGTQTIPFSATISNKSETRGLTEDATTQTIGAQWEVGDQVALIHGATVDVMTVDKVTDTGSATITGTLTGVLKAVKVLVVYIGSDNTAMASLKTTLEGQNLEMISIDDINKAVKGMLATQSGTLEAVSAAADYRYAYADLKIAKGKATFTNTVTLPSMTAVWKVNLTTDGTTATALQAKKLVVTADGETVTADLGTGTNYMFYLAFIPNGSTNYSFTATDADNKEYSCDLTLKKALETGYYYVSTLTVKVPTVGVTGVTLNTSTLELIAGDTESLTATVAPSDATNKAVTWMSSKESIATVDADGKVTAVGAGTATITVTTTDGSFTATCTVTVSKVAGSISYATQTVEKTTSDAAFTNTLTKVGDGAVTYSSDKESVATVNSTTGEVTIKGAGEATITATVADSDTYTYATTTATYKVTVKAVVVGALDQYGNGGDPLN